MQVALFGNANGPRDALFSTNLRRLLNGSGFTNPEIIDQRNTGIGAGPFATIGPTPRFGGSFRTIVYSPNDGLVECYSFAAPARDQNEDGVRVTRVQ
jgi:hypothetical protein